MRPGHTLALMISGLEWVPGLLRCHQKGEQFHLFLEGLGSYPRL